MALNKRGKYWHYSFEYRKRKFQGSTGQTNKNKAKLVEAQVRSNAALEHFGISPPKSAPLFKDFMEGRFLDDVRQNAKKPLTVLFYESRTRQLLRFGPFQMARVDEVDESMIGEFVMRRKSPTVAKLNKAIGMKVGVIPDGMATTRSSASIATINRDLVTIRKALRLAFKWRLIDRLPLISRLPGERNREFVLSQEMECQYLELATYPLKQAAILMLDLGLRPMECLSLRKADCAGIAADPAPGKTESLRMIDPTVPTAAVFIRSGKSKNAVRTLPLTDRAKAAIELLCALWPDSEWLFPGRKGGHLGRWALNRAHLALKAQANLGANRLENSPTVRTAEIPDMAGPRMAAFPAEFVLYSFRHSFGTRLHESGADAHAIKKAMGHYSVVVSEKYIHPGDPYLERAMRQKELMDKRFRGEVHEGESSEVGR